jgi:hypothetical protein
MTSKKSKGNGQDRCRVVADGMLRSHPSQKRAKDGAPEGLWLMKGNERPQVLRLRYASLRMTISFLELFSAQGFHGFDLRGAAAGEGSGGYGGQSEEEDYGEHDGEVGG